MQFVKPVLYFFTQNTRTEKPVFQENSSLEYHFGDIIEFIQYKYLLFLACAFIVLR